MRGTGFLKTLSTIVGDIGRARRAVAVYEQLDGLSDKSLAARGLSRGDLPARAFETAFGASR